MKKQEAPQKNDPKKEDVHPPRPNCAKNKEPPKEPEKKETRNCYAFKKHPSATSVKYQPRVCVDPDRYKKKCPPPIEICKDPNIENLCPVKKKRLSALEIEDDSDIVVAERLKPPKCPTVENPCANDNIPKVVIPEVREYSCNNKDADKNYPCGEQDDD